MSNNGSACYHRIVAATAVAGGLALGVASAAGLSQAVAPLSPTEPNPQIPAAQAESAALKQQAVALARRLTETYPDEGLAYALLGSAYFNTGHSEEAATYLRKCLELRPNQADAYGILGRMAYDKGNIEESVRMFEQALQRGPPNPEILNQLGRALMDLGKADEAIRVLEKAVQCPDPISQSYYLLGQANLQVGKFPLAKENFQRAIALLPDHTQAFFGLYRACLGLGQTDEAQRYRERFVKLEAIDRRSLKERSAQEDTMTGLPAVRETVARTFFGAAQVYQLHEQPSEAAELFYKAASLDGENAVYRSALEALYVRRKELTQGAAAFEQLVSEQPTNHLNYFFLGRMHSRLGQAGKAGAAYRKVQELAPEWPEGYRVLADLDLRANREPAEARASAQRLIDLEPTGPHYFLLALACLKTGDRPGAVAAMKEAVALVPNEPRYRDMLQQLESTPRQGIRPGQTP